MKQLGWIPSGRTTTAERVRTVVNASMLLASTLALGGCFAFFDDEPEQAPASVLDVAVGADIVLQLEDGGCREDGLTRCLSERPVELHAVELEGGAFELGDHELDARDELSIDLTARTRGESTVVVSYTDFFGREHEDRFRLRALEITRVDASVRCDGPVAPDSVYPVSSGASFDLDLYAYADDRILETGNLELVVDAGLLAVDDGTLTAPTQTGRYDVQLRGPDSLPLEVLVYDPEDIELSLSAAEIPLPGEDGEGVALVRAIGGAPACVHEGRTPAWVRVSAGDCTPVIGGYALEGEIPLDLTEGNAQLLVEGSGSCTLEAAVVGGEVTSIELDQHAPYPSPRAWDDTRLTASPTEVPPALASTQTCREVADLSRGGCRILDVGGFPVPSVDCLRSWDWGVSHRDGGVGHDNLPAGYVGVGLQTNLHARVDYEVLGLGRESYPPAGVDVQVAPQDGLVAYADGCVNDDNASIAVLVDAPGTYDLTLSATNINKTDAVTVRARTVGEVVFDTEATDVVDSGSVSRAHFFVGSQTHVSVAYEDGSGVPLGGQAPLFAYTDDPDARPAIQGGATPQLHTGTTPNVIVLETDLTEDQYRVNVVDLDAVDEVTGLAEPTVSVDESECVTVQALAADGRQIYGRAPERPVLRITGGDALVVEDTAADPEQPRLCIRGWAPGDASVELRWGSLERSYAWSVL